MKVGEVNKTMLVVLLVAALGAGGWLWYSMLYKPASEAAVSARTAKEGAETALAGAEQRLRDATANEGKVDKSDVAKVVTANKAIPKKHQRTEALITLDRIAKQSGVDIRTVTPSDQTSTAIGTETQTLVPLDMEVEAVGTYPALMRFSQLVQELVDVNRDKAYLRGPFMSIVKMEFGSDESSSEASGEQELKPGQRSLTVVLRLFAEGSSGTVAGADSAQPGTAAAAGTTPPAAGTTPPAAGTTPPAAGATPPAAGATPPAAGTTPPPAANETIPSGAS